jgi:serine/threonine protein kinase
MSNAVEILVLVRAALAACVHVSVGCMEFQCEEATDAQLTGLLNRATVLAKHVTALLEALATAPSVYEAHSRGVKQSVTMLLMVIKAVPRQGEAAKDKLAAACAAVRNSPIEILFHFYQLIIFIYLFIFFIQLSTELENVVVQLDDSVSANASSASTTARTSCSLHAALSGCTSATESHARDAHWHAGDFDNVRSATQLPPTALAMLHIAGVSTAQLEANLALALVCFRYEENASFVPSLTAADSAAPAAPSMFVSDAEAQLMREKYSLVGATSACDVGRSFLYGMPDADGQTGALVAVRRLPYTSGEHRRALVARVALLERATPHRNIVAPFALADMKRDGVLWLVTEHLPGVCLGAYLQRVPLADDVVAYVALEVMRALAHLHTLGIAHRRVAPTSVWVCDTGAVKLIDFSCCTDTLVGASSDRIGPLAFMAPEMVRGEPQGLPSDIWSLGMCVLWMFGECTAQYDGAVHAFVSAVAGRVPSQRRTPVARDFLSLCLRLRAEARATVAVLLKHEFLRDAWKGVSEQKLRFLAAEMMTNAILQQQQQQQQTQTQQTT